MAADNHRYVICVVQFQFFEESVRSSDRCIGFYCSVRLHSGEHPVIEVVLHYCLLHFRFLLCQDGGVPFEPFVEFSKPGSGLLKRHAALEASIWL